MKRLLLIVLPLLFIVSCSKPVEDSTLINKDGLMYTPDSDKPYTGDVFELYDNGNRKLSGILKGGKKDGLVTSWYENGQKMD